MSQNLFCLIKRKWRQMFDGHQFFPLEQVLRILIFSQNRRPVTLKPPICRTRGKNLRVFPLEGPLIHLIILQNFNKIIQIALFQFLLEK